MKTGEATKISEISRGMTIQADGDNICIINDQIYLHDGAPPSKSKFYIINVSKDSRKLVATYSGVDRYYSSRDIVATNDIIYFTRNKNTLYYWDILKSEIA